MAAKFQFHNGSIKSDNLKKALKEKGVGFNSTMVRLKDVRDWDESMRSQGVSIPQWFD